MVLTGLFVYVGLSQDDGRAFWLALASVSAINALRRD